MSLSLNLTLALASTASQPVEGPASPPALAAMLVTDRPVAVERRGSGLLATGALFGGLGLAANAVRIGLSRRLCNEVAYDRENRTLYGTAPCVTGSQALLFLSPSALALNVAAFGLIASGSSVHGKWAAQWADERDRRPRRGVAQFSVGAAVMFGGLVGYAIVRGASYADMLGFNTCHELHGLGIKDPDPANSAFAQCLRGRYSGYLVGIAASQAASVIGVGLFAHGISYHRHARVFDTVARHQLRLQPALSPVWTGLSLSGKF